MLGQKGGGVAASIARPRGAGAQSVSVDCHGQVVALLRAEAGFDRLIGVERRIDHLIQLAATRN
jgi:hypothetical protein